MKIIFLEKDVKDILKNYVERIFPGSKVTEVKDKYNDYECTTELEAKKKEEEKTT